MGNRLADAGRITPSHLRAAAEAFRVHQAHQAWRQHGSWVSAHPGRAVRPANGSPRRPVSPRRTTGPRPVLAAVRAELDDLLGDAVLVLPSAAGPAP